MLNQWQPLFTCYLSLTFIHFYVFTKVLNYQQWILGKCLSFIHINLCTNIAGNSNTFENKIKRQHSFTTNLYKNQTYTYPKEYIPIFFAHAKTAYNSTKRPYKRTYQNYHQNYHLTQITCLFLYLYIYHQYVMKGSNRRESLCHHTVVNISRILRYIIDYHITHHVSLQRSLLHSNVPVSYSS